MRAPYSLHTQFFYLSSHLRACSYQDMSAGELIDRLLRNRPLSFVNAEDTYLLRCGRTFDTHAHTVVKSLDKYAHS